ncbi:protein Hook homolog 2-like isoform X2 [Polypterus senegalus]|uniref:protein Hook homolog 2-like isoform X2 n=1 Tax=Polypterus senegalus TaxID=55291 RepID=UPI0019641FDF|nr:protein Hook homolog 2-like isoform X2 [Polypterus senegalus]
MTNFSAPLPAPPRRCKHRRPYKLKTFQVPSCTSKEDLTNGVAIAHVLHRIDPSWFNEAWLGRIKEERGQNWRLKVSNLKKILQSMLEYYHEVLLQQISDNHLPDVNRIGELNDVTELGKLVQLVLGCAVSCEKKHEHIEQIMTLEESVQHVVMTAIQELLTKDTVDSASPETYGDFDYQSRKYYFLSEEIEEKDDLSQRCQELEQQVSTILEEKNALLSELAELQKHGTQRPEAPDETATITSKKLLLLQTQLEQLQEENYRLDTSKDDLQIRAEELERQVAELQHRNEELTSLAEEAQSLKDEMDILRHSSDRVNRLEAMVDTYKKKLEDLGDLRRQVRLLEERNTVYMQRTCELEEELRKANSARSQLEIYKKQIQELHSKHSSEAIKAEKWQFEYKNVHLKYEALLKEKERLMVDRDALRERIEDMCFVQFQPQHLRQREDSLCDEGVQNLTAEMMPAELKETILRLQQENKTLCAEEEASRQKLSEVQSQLEESRRSQNRLETENRLNQLQITALRSQVEELQKALQEQDSKAEDAISLLLKRKLDEHLVKLHEAHSDLQKKREYIDGLEPKVDSSTAKKIDELEEILKKKDADLKMMQERCNRYVERARTVIKTLDAKQPDAVAPEVVALKNQLQEKEKKLQHLEHDFEKAKSRHEKEEKLIISAWYNMGMALQHRVTQDRTGTPGQAQSFLAQQRQFTNARRGHLSRLQQTLPR